MLCKKKVLPCKWLKVRQNVQRCNTSPCISLMKPKHVMREASSTPPCTPQCCATPLTLTTCLHTPHIHSKDDTQHGERMCHPQLTYEIGEGLKKRTLHSERAQWDHEKIAENSPTTVTQGFGATQKIPQDTWVSYTSQNASMCKVYPLYTLENSPPASIPFLAGTIPHGENT